MVVIIQHRDLRRCRRQSEQVRRSKVVSTSDAADFFWVDLGATGPVDLEAPRGVTILALAKAQPSSRSVSTRTKGFA